MLAVRGKADGWRRSVGMWICWFCVWSLESRRHRLALPCCPAYASPPLLPPPYAGWLPSAGGEATGTAALLSSAASSPLPLFQASSWPQHPELLVQYKLLPPTLVLQQSHQPYSALGAPPLLLLLLAAGGESLLSIDFFLPLPLSQSVAFASISSQMWLHSTPPSAISLCSRVVRFVHLLGRGLFFVFSPLTTSICNFC